MTFGDVMLFPDKGILEAEVLTSGRVESLIEVLKHICTGIPILEASLEMRPSYKNPPDQEAFEANRKLLKEGLDCKVTASINKAVNESFGIYCGFCSCTEEQAGKKLLRCACKSEYYCCKNHQREDWNDHKQQCRRIRGES